jgi:hypothetical protein
MRKVFFPPLKTISSGPKNIMIMPWASPIHCVPSMAIKLQFYFHLLDLPHPFMLPKKNLVAIDNSMDLKKD